MSSTEQETQGIRDPLVGLSPNELILGRNIFPIVFGLSTYSALAQQDPVTGFFPISHANDRREIALVHTAIELGYNFFDTAEAYGDSELLLGQTLKDYPRADFLIATKVGIRPNPTIRASIHRSIERLGTVPDILFVHDRWEGQMEEEMDNCLAALDQAVDQGYTQAIGISNFRPAELQRAIDRLEHKPRFYQAKINLVNPRRDLQETLAICKENGLVYMASSALDRGKVLGETVNPTVLEIAKKYEMTPAQVGIFAVRSLGTLPLVQTHNIAHMEENSRTLGFTLEQSDVANLTKILLRQ